MKVIAFPSGGRNVEAPGASTASVAMTVGWAGAERSNLMSRLSAVLTISQRLSGAHVGGAVTLRANRRSSPDGQSMTRSSRCSSAVRVKAR